MAISGLQQARRRWVLMLAYHFPPENEIGALRPHRFSRYLTQHGWTPHVITAADVSSRADLPAETVVDPFSDPVKRGWEWQQERAIRKFLLPGAIGIRWSSLAYQAAAKFITSHPGDDITIFSTWPPLGTHMAASRLKRRFGLPWIADFRDPLADNHVHKNVPSHTRAIYRWLERTWLQSADLFIANTDEAEAVLKRKYPAHAHKIHLIWNGFDPQQRIRPEPLQAMPVRIFSHIGALYEGRTAAPLIEAMARLFDTGRLAPGSLRLELTGPAAPSCLPHPRLLEAAQTQGWLKLTDQQVPKEEAVRLAQTSHGLIIVQPQSVIQIPGKVYDYLQIGRPVLAFVPRHSCVERVLAQTNVQSKILYTDLSVEQFDAELLQYFALPNDAVPAGPWFETTFDVERQTATLSHLMESVQPQQQHAESSASHR